MFTEEQNDTFSKLFPHLKKDSKTEVQAHTLLGMGDENFTKLFKDPDTSIKGDHYEMERVMSRAKTLKLV